MAAVDNDGAVLAACAGHRDRDDAR